MVQTRKVNKNRETRSEEEIKLQKALDIAMEAIEFYGDRDNWIPYKVGSGTKTRINITDVVAYKDTKKIRIGGEKAREAKQKINEVLGE